MVLLLLMGVKRISLMQTILLIILAPPKTGFSRLTSPNVMGTRQAKPGGATYECKEGRSNTDEFYQ